MESGCKCLPGFRFHPTEEELLDFYLKSMVLGKKMRGDVIGFLNIYNYHPRELPQMAKTGEREWYFMVPRDRKHGGGGGRPNRTTASGFWKATGSDRQIVSGSGPKRVIGLKKTLVFYEGRAPRGTKTNWIMNEFRLPDKANSKEDRDVVVCKIYMKATSLKVLEQRAAMEEDSSFSPPPTLHLELQQYPKRDTQMPSSSSTSSSLVLPNNLPELQLPKMNTTDWMQDSFWLNLSPWLDNFTPFIPMC